MKANTARFEKRSRVRAKTSRTQTGRLALEVPQRKALSEEAGNAIFIMMANNLSGFRFDRGLPIRRRIGLVGNLKHAQIIFSVPEDHNVVKAELLAQSRHAITLAAIAVVNIHPAELLILYGCTGVGHQPRFACDAVNHSLHRLVRPMALKQITLEESGMAERGSSGSFLSSSNNCAILPSISFFRGP